MGSNAPVIESHNGHFWSMDSLDQLFIRLSEQNSDLSKTTTTTTESGFSSLKPAMSRVTTNHHHFFHTSTYCSLFSKVWIDIVQSYFRFVFCTSKNNELFLSSIDLSSTKVCTKSSSCTFLFTKILLTFCRHPYWSVTNFQISTPVCSPAWSLILA